MLCGLPHTVAYVEQPPSPATGPWLRGVMVGKVVWFRERLEFQRLGLQPSAQLVLAWATAVWLATRKGCTKAVQWCLPTMGR